MNKIYCLIKHFPWPCTVFPLFVSLAGSFLADAQGIYVSPSPHAAGLLKDANIPANLNTGTLEITIPFYELPAQEINIPVGLSYHASGIKVHEIAGPAGLGFALNAGGAITRIVRGLPDEMGYCGPEQHGNYTIYDQHYYTSVASGRYDGEPDLFYYNFLGRTGKFVINGDGDPLLIPKQDIKITPAIGIKGEGKWIITDENGTQFIFGQYENEKEMTTTYSRAYGETTYTEDKSYISTWYISEVISANGITLANFEYFLGDNIESRTFLDRKSDIIGQSCDKSGTEIERSFYRTVVQPKYIKKIGSSSGNLYFTYATGREDLPGGKILTMISIKDYADREIFHYELDFDYFDAYASIYSKRWKNSLLEEGYRLALKSIERVKDGARQLYRSFEYNDLQLPPRNSIYIDSYGYFNAYFVYGNNNWRVHYSNLPKVEIDGDSFLGAERGISGFAAALILEKINYPTGGFSKFIYENNSGGGGVRIAEVQTVDDETHVPITKTYKYQDAQVLTHPVFYYRYKFYGTNGPNYGIFGDLLGIDSDCEVEYLIRKSNSFTAVHDLNGASVSYGKVIETSSDGSKSIYVFSNHPDLEPSVKASPAPCRRGEPCDRSLDPNGPPFASNTYRGYMRGLLEKKIDLSSAGDTVKVLINHYDVSEHTDKIPGIVVQGDLQSAGQPVYHIGEYESISRYVFLEYTKTKIFDQEDLSNSKRIEFKKNFVYHPVYQTLVKEIISQNGVGNILTTTYKYPIDYVPDCEPEYLSCQENCLCVGTDPSCLQCLQECENKREACEEYMSNEEAKHAIIKMNDRHIIRPVIEKGVWVEDNGTNKLLMADLTEYKMEHGLLVPGKVLSFKANDGVTDFMESNLSSNGNFEYDSRYRIERTFNDYDIYGNLLKQTSQDGIVTTFEWGYNNSLLTANNINPNTPFAKRTEYVHDPLVGLKSVKDPNGFITTYEYDKLNRLQSIKDHNGNIIKAYKYRYATDKLIPSFTNGLVIAEKSIKFSTTTNDLPYGITTNTWDFGDGSPLYKSTSNIAYHTYNASGDYNVTLSVKNPEYGEESISKPVRVYAVGTNSIEFGGEGSANMALKRTINFTVEYPGELKLLFNGIANDNGGDLSGSPVSVKLSGSLNSSYTYFPEESSISCNNLTLLGTFNVSPGDYSIELEIVSSGYNWASCGFLEFPSLTY